MRAMRQQNRPFTVRSRLAWLLAMLALLWHVGMGVQSAGHQTRMALAPTPVWFLATAGVLIGAAQAGTTYAVIYGVLGRQIPVARRSWAMGVTAAAGSFGQFFMVPVEGGLIAVAAVAISPLGYLAIPLLTGWTMAAANALF